MKKIFIYYSLSGNGDLVNDYLTKKGYDSKKIEVKNKLPKNYFLSIVIGGYKAMVNYKETIINFDINIDDYDEIVIGSPIWNDRLSSPISTLLNEINLDNKIVKFILYSGSGKNDRADGFIKNKYPNAKVINIKEPKKYSEELNKISE